jgi:hypothetical protein
MMEFTFKVGSIWIISNLEIHFPGISFILSQNWEKIGKGFYFIPANELQGYILGITIASHILHEFPVLISKRFC